VKRWNGQRELLGAIPVGDRGRFVNESARCQVPGCERATNDHKPFCLEHVASMPYVSGILSAARKRERRKCRVCRAWFRTSNPNRVTCSQGCAHKAKNGLRLFTCAGCGQVREGGHKQRLCGACKKARAK